MAVTPFVVSFNISLKSKFNGHVSHPKHLLNFLPVRSHLCFLFLFLHLKALEPGDPMSVFKKYIEVKHSLLAD